MASAAPAVVLADRAFLRALLRYVRRLERDVGEGGFLVIRVPPWRLSRGGGADLGGLFSAPELAEKVYLAMRGVGRVPITRSVLRRGCSISTAELLRSAVISSERLDGFRQNLHSRAA
jgi:hypothetical protein